MLNEHTETNVPVLVVNDTRVDRHHGCEAVMTSICSLLEVNGMYAQHLWPAHADWKEDPTFDMMLREVSLVLVNGEGTIHHDRVAGRRLLEVGERAREQGLPVALINVGWEANGPDFLKLLGGFDLIAARDSRSAEQMRTGGAEVRVVPDLSFWFALTRACESNNNKRAGIGFTDNVDRTESQLLDRLRRSCGGQTLAIVHGQLGLSGWLKFLRDGVGLRQDLVRPFRLAALLKLRHRLWRESSYSIDTFLAEIACFELLVSGRFHACTLALANYTPLVARSSNTGKISALFHDVGIEPWRAEIPLVPELVLNARDCGWSKAEKAALDNYLPQAVVSAEQLFVDLARLVSR